MILLHADKDCAFCHGSSVVGFTSPYGAVNDFNCGCAMQRATAEEKDKIDNGEDYQIAPAKELKRL
jgi:hypothetical protein